MSEGDDYAALAKRALLDRLDKADSAEEAFGKGMDLGTQLALKKADSDATADRWGRIVEAVERIADKFLDRLDAAELRRAATANPPPKSDATAQLAEGSHAKILGIISERPPVDEAAKVLTEAGVTQENLPAILDAIRQGPGWTEFLDEQPDWLTAVTAALPSTPDAKAEPAA